MDIIFFDSIVYMKNMTNENFNPLRLFQSLTLVTDMPAKR